MNSASRLVSLSAAACVVAAAFVNGASGRQTPPRGVGNSAEAARLESERRDREMRAADLREREFLLRTMAAERRPANPPAPRLALAQIREDFIRIQVLNNDLAQAVSRGGALDLKFVSKSAAEIKKLAARLRENLARPGPADEGGRDETRAAPPPEQLGPALSELDGLVLRFVDGVVAKGVLLLDAQSSAQRRRELEAIIELSARVKKASEKLGRSTR
jgi:hypothetical protein